LTSFPWKNILPTVPISKRSEIFSLESHFSEWTVDLFGVEYTWDAHPKYRWYRHEMVLTLPQLMACDSDTVDGILNDFFLLLPLCERSGVRKEFRTDLPLKPTTKSWLALKD